jgi:hypothetical protein
MLIGPRRGAFLMVAIILTTDLSLAVSLMFV